MTPLFKNLPEAVLAALIIHAVSHLMKVGEFKRYYGERRPEFWLGLATLVGVITLDVLPGLVIGIVSMLLLVVYNASRPHLSVLGAVPGSAGGYGNIGRHPEYTAIPDVLVLRLEAPLFYVNAALVRNRIKVLVGAAEPTPRAVILDAGANGDRLDITGAETMIELVAELHAAGTTSRWPRSGCRCSQQRADRASWPLSATTGSSTRFGRPSRRFRSSDRSIPGMRAGR